MWYASIFRPLKRSLVEICTENKPIYLCGDFNLNLESINVECERHTISVENHYSSHIDHILQINMETLDFPEFTVLAGTKDMQLSEEQIIQENDYHSERIKFGELNINGLGSPCYRSLFCHDAIKN